MCTNFIFIFAENNNTMKVRISLRMEENLKEALDKVAEATGRDRTEIIEEFCLAGIRGLQRMANEKKQQQHGTQG